MHYDLVGEVEPDVNRNLSSIRARVFSAVYPQGRREDPLWGGAFQWQT